MRMALANQRRVNGRSYAQGSLWTAVMTRTRAAYSSPKRNGKNVPTGQRLALPPLSTCVISQVRKPDLEG